MAFKQSLSIVSHFHGPCVLCNFDFWRFHEFFRKCIDVCWCKMLCYDAMMKLIIKNDSYFLKKSRWCGWIRLSEMELAVRARLTSSWKLDMMVRWLINTKLNINFFIFCSLLRKKSGFLPKYQGYSLAKWIFTKSSMVVQVSTRSWMPVFWSPNGK